MILRSDISIGTRRLLLSTDILQMSRETSRPYPSHESNNGRMGDSRSPSGWANVDIAEKFIFGFSMSPPTILLSGNHLEICQ